MIVCFFGHKDTPEAIRPALERVIACLIDRGAESFLVGNQGRFDTRMLAVLRKVATKNSEISYRVVLAYMPKPGDNEFHPGESMLPEEMESIHPKYAIAHRNRWMVEQADTAVVYVAHGWGGAAKYASIMEKQGKKVINLFERSFGIE